MNPVVGVVPERWTLDEYRQTAAGEKVRVLETAP